MHLYVHVSIHLYAHVSNTFAYVGMSPRVHVQYSCVDSLNVFEKNDYMCMCVSVHVNKYVCMYV
jgi:hypothetical protein